MITVSKLLMFCAFTCFILASFGVRFPLEIVPLGPSFLAASYLVP